MSTCARPADAPLAQDPDDGAEPDQRRSLQVAIGEKRTAISVASEFASRFFKSSRFDEMGTVAEEATKAVNELRVAGADQVWLAGQVETDGVDGNNALEGAFRIACSPKGEHVYVSAGRFGGDQAVSVFAAQPDGTLKLVEEHVNDIDDLKDFQGGKGGSNHEGVRVSAKFDQHRGIRQAHRQTGLRCHFSHTGKKLTDYPAGRYPS